MAAPSYVGGLFAWIGLVVFCLGVEEGKWLLFQMALLKIVASEAKLSEAD